MITARGLSFARLGVFAAASLSCAAFAQLPPGRLVMPQGSSARMPAMQPPNWQEIPITPWGMLCGSCVAPINITSRTTIVRWGERGEKLVLAGRIYREDGVTPAAGVTMWVFQADADGRYAEDDDLTRTRINGWVRTDAEGNYQLTTIRPGADPEGKSAARIHAQVFGPAMPEREIEAFRFEDDRRLSDEERRLASAGRFSPVVRLARDAAGVWHGQRDIRITDRSSR